MGAQGDVGSKGATRVGTANHDAAVHRAFDAWPAHVAVLDASGRIVAINRAWKRSAAANGGDGVGVGADYVAACAAASTAGPSAAELLGGLRQVLAGTVAELVLEYPGASGDEDRWFRLEARRLDGDAAPQLLIVREDVTEQRRDHDHALASSQLLAEIDAAVVATDLRGVVTLWNPGAERLYGWSAEEAVGQPVYEMVVPVDRIGHARELIGEPDAAGWEGEFTANRRDGTTFPVHVRNAVVRDRTGAVSGMVSVSVDLTERRAAERELTRSARHLRAVTDSIGDGLCTLDGDGLMTYVNPPGQRLLRTPLSDLIGRSFPARLRGDGTGSAWAALDGLASAARRSACQLVLPDESEIPIEYVATPLGVEADVADAGWVVSFRDVSARRAREDELAEKVEQVVWLGRIREALEHDRFVLHAQPIVDVATGATVQHELLLRMQDPDDPSSLIAPGLFLPTAEALGVAPSIDRWVLAEGIAIAAQGRAVEINLSATSLEDVALPHLIEQLLADTGADPADVVFEITETALLHNHATARRFAADVRQLGCLLALDDFGTGYGGFTYLKTFPLDFLKIDIEFVRDAVTDPASRHVIGAVVSLAEAFGLQTIAEGVEDEATLELLRDLHVDQAQGFLLGRPGPLDALLTTTEQEANR